MINHTTSESICSAGRDIATSLTTTKRCQLLFFLRMVAVFTFIAVASQNVQIARLIVDCSSFNDITDTSDSNEPQSQPPETSQSKSSSSTTSSAATAAAEWKNKNSTFYPLTTATAIIQSLTFILIMAKPLLFLLV